MLDLLTINFHPLRWDSPWLTCSIPDVVQDSVHPETNRFCHPGDEFRADLPGLIPIRAVWYPRDHGIDFRLGQADGCCDRVFLPATRRASDRIEAEDHGRAF
jgi:hypothetical protein